MKIEEKRIKRVREILLESKLLDIVESRSILFFPIKIEEKVSETEMGVVLLESTKKEGSSKLVVPGLIVSDDDVTSPTAGVYLGYASIEYAVPFNVSDFHYFLNGRGSLTKKRLDELCELECLLIRKENSLISFRFKD
jgi:hypothetical protein